MSAKRDEAALMFPITGVRQAAARERAKDAFENA
jgi:hypothetical protein